MKKIPYGIINYKELIEENYYYVDKTMYLEKLENYKKTLIYLRPGRFGKSLFTSMMSYYYDVKSADLFESLFKETYVYKHPTKGKNNYYILKFDFSGIESANQDEKELAIRFKKRVISGIVGFNNHYDTKIEINEEDNSSEIIDSFIRKFESLKLEHSLYIMIDEYDNFTNAILEGDANRFKSVVGNEGVIKAFYATIKEYIGLGKVGRFFATGICPITLNSMTTGFNIATDISTDIRFNSMIGLTHEEVKKLLEELVEEKDRENIYNIMIENYDGYLFNKDSNEKVFNATLVMYLLDYYEDFKSVPEKILDDNIAVNYEKIGNLIRLENNKYYEDLLNELLKTSEISGELKTKFNLEEKFSKEDIISLLYYFGYLTINGFDIYLEKTIFKIPNQVMKDTYNNYFIAILEDNNIEFNDEEQKASIKEILETGKIEHISNYVSEILKESSNRIFMKFDEKYVQLVYDILLRNKLINVYTEYPCNNGYVDILITKNNELAHHNIMIELKYIKKSEYSDKLLNSKIEEGKRQIEEYSKDERLVSPLKKYVVVFSGYECKKIVEV